MDFHLPPPIRSFRAGEGFPFPTFSPEDEILNAPGAFGPIGDTEGASFFVAFARRWPDNAVNEGTHAA
ncbi:MAG: hypothetical protein WBC70_13840, partial [Candidatus Aminicenantales bacterium]